MTLETAITTYVEAFDEGPPIFGLPEDEALALIEEALRTGEKVTEGVEADMPKDAYL